VLEKYVDAAVTVMSPPATEALCTAALVARST
jgi:hypothetical protein